MPLGIAAVALGIALAYSGYKGMKLQDVVAVNLLGKARAASSSSTSSSAGTSSAGGTSSTYNAQVPAAARNGGAVVTEAKRYLGVKYLWGGASPSTGFDCSGLVQYVFKRVAAVTLPHLAAAQQVLGTGVPLSQLEAGDVVFYGTPAHHCGIYTGGGQIIAAPHTGDVVKVQAVNGPGRPTNARRYV